MTSFKPFLRWVILGGTLFFLAKALKDRAQEVAAIHIDGEGWKNLAIALIITLMAHIWASLVWCWILRSLKQPIGYKWAIRVYLKTNLAKYLPGNVWHYYGRIAAVTDAGGSLGVASLSVLLEPLLMAAAALIIALTSSELNTQSWSFSILSIFTVCFVIHPRILNPLVQFLSRFKGKAPDTNNFVFKNYPFLPLLAELGFVGLRGTGFLFTLMALTPINPHQIPQLLSEFSMAWLLGLVVPGAPGGIGVFEATAMVLLGKHFSAGLLLGAVALFRLVSILAEAGAAGLATLSDRC
ncbi:MAG: hypothetical protein NVS2B14_05260 [Chamaesiphon sp.]